MGEQYLDYGRLSANPSQYTGQIRREILMDNTINNPNKQLSQKIDQSFQQYQQQKGQFIINDNPARNTVRGVEVEQFVPNRLQSTNNVNEQQITYNKIKQIENSLQTFKLQLEKQLAKQKEKIQYQNLIFFIIIIAVIVVCGMINASQTKNLVQKLKQYEQKSNRPGDHIDVKIIYGFQLFLQIKYMVSLYEIGKGGFSRCFSSDSSNYVIKYINKRKQKLIDQEKKEVDNTENIKNEIDIHQQLSGINSRINSGINSGINSHINSGTSDYIVKLIDYTEKDDVFCIKLEKCNCDLGYFAHKVDLSDQQLLQIAYQIILGFQYIHSQQIYHFDIKPANILVKFDSCGNFNLKICDFGLSQHGIQGNGHKGTNSFVDPIMVSTKKYDPSNDIWSFGITLLKITQKQADFSFLSFEQFKHGFTDIIKYKLTKLVNSVKNHKIKEIIAKCLKFDQVKRFSFSQLLEYMQETYPNLNPNCYNNNLPPRNIQSIRNSNKYTAVFLGEYICVRLYGKNSIFHDIVVDQKEKEVVSPLSDEEFFNVALKQIKKITAKCGIKPQQYTRKQRQLDITWDKLEIVDHNTRIQLKFYGKQYYYLLENEKKVCVVDKGLKFLYDGQKMVCIANSDDNY